MRSSKLPEIDGSAPDLIHPVIGFRQWRLDDDGLASLIMDYRWRGAECVAACSANTHPPAEAPVNGCVCGVYAWYDPCPRTASAPDYVAGVVVLWGRVELHATGMRAQHARVVALALPVSRWGKRRRVMAMAERLSVPALPHGALKPVALVYGKPVPPNLRPPRSWATAGTQPIGVVPRAFGPTRLGARTFEQEEEP
jgi:hypothetical protein